MGKWKVNITPTERIARVLVGLGAVMGGLLLLTAAESTLEGVLEVLLVIAGLDLVVTGATGHCPLYQKLGRVPTSWRGRAS